MSIHTQRITLDMSKASAPPTIRLGQGDKSGTTLVVDVTDGGTAFDLAGKQVKFCMRLPKRGGYYEVAGTASGNTATFQIDESVAASTPGRTEVAYVEVMQGSTSVCSASRANVIILPSAYEGVDPARVWDNGVERFLANAAATINADTAAIEAAIAQAQSDVADAVEDANDASSRAEAAIAAIGDISELAVPAGSPDTRGGFKVGSGLHADSDVLHLGPMEGESGCAIFAVEGEGWGEQDSTVGKNLAKPLTQAATASGITATPQPDGSVKLSGTSTTDNAIQVTLGTTALSAGIAYTASIGEYGGTGVSDFGITGYSRNKTVTPSSDFAYAGIHVFIPNGTTVNATIYPQLEAGATATSYEPYTGGKASPSPEYPQEVRVAKGRNLLKLERAFDGTNINAVNMSNVSVANQVLSFTASTANPYFGAAVASGNAVQPSAGTLVEVEPNTPYVVSSGAFSQIFVTQVDSGKVSLGYSSTNSNTMAFTTKENARYVLVRVGLNAATVGASYSGTVQLELGSTPTPYVPYGHVGLETRGRNLLPNVVSSQVLNGITLTRNADGSLTMNGTATAETRFYLTASSGLENIVAEVIKQGTVTLSTGNPSVSGTRLEIAYYNGGTYQGVVNRVTNGASSLTFSAPSVEFNVAKVYVLIVNGTTVNNLTFYPQLELGSTAHAYTPYHRATTPIPLPSKGWAGSLPDGTADALRVDSAGRCEWTLPVGGETFDGSEAWVYYNNWSDNPGHYCYYLNMPQKRAQMSGTVVSMASHFTVRRMSEVDFSNTANKANRTVGNAAYSTPNGGFKDFTLWSAESSAANFKTWLSSHNVELYYPLATPTTEHTYIDLPEIPEGTTVTCPELDNVGATFIVKGASAIVRHVENVRRYVEEALADLATAIASL